MEELWEALFIKYLSEVLEAYKTTNVSWTTSMKMYESHGFKVYPISFCGREDCSTQVSENHFVDDFHHVRREKRALRMTHPKEIVDGNTHDEERPFQEGEIRGQESIPPNPSHGEVEYLHPVFDASSNEDYKYSEGHEDSTSKDIIDKEVNSNKGVEPRRDTHQEQEKEVHKDAERSTHLNQIRAINTNQKEEDYSSMLVEDNNRSSLSQEEEQDKYLSEEAEPSVVTHQDNTREKDEYVDAAQLFVGRGNEIHPPKDDESNTEQELSTLSTSSTVQHISFPSSSEKCEHIDSMGAQDEGCIHTRKYEEQEKDQNDYNEKDRFNNRRVNDPHKTVKDDEIPLSGIKEVEDVLSREEEKQSSTITSREEQRGRHNEVSSRGGSQNQDFVSESKDGELQSSSERLYSTKERYDPKANEKYVEREEHLVLAVARNKDVINTETVDYTRSRPPIISDDDQNKLSTFKTEREERLPLSRKQEQFPHEDKLDHIIRDKEEDVPTRTMVGDTKDMDGEQRVEHRSSMVVEDRGRLQESQNREERTGRYTEKEKYERKVNRQEQDSLIKHPRDRREEGKQEIPKKLSSHGRVNSRTSSSSKDNELRSSLQQTHTSHKEDRLAQGDSIDREDRRVVAVHTKRILDKKELTDEGQAGSSVDGKYLREEDSTAMDEHQLDISYRTG